MKYTQRKMESKLSIYNSTLKFERRVLYRQIIFLSQRSNHCQVKYDWTTYAFMVFLHYYDHDAVYADHNFHLSY